MNNLRRFILKPEAGSLLSARSLLKVSSGRANAFLIVPKRNYFAGYYELVMDEEEVHKNNDERNMGDYPVLPDVNLQFRDPYHPWDDPMEMRNYGEPLPVKFTCNFSLTPDIHRTQDSIIWWQLFLTSIGFLTFWNLCGVLFDRQTSFNKTVPPTLDYYAHSSLDRQVKAVQAFAEKYPAYGSLDRPAFSAHLKHDYSNGYLNQKNIEQARKNWNAKWGPGRYVPKDENGKPIFDTEQLVADLAAKKKK